MIVVSQEGAQLLWRTWFGLSALGDPVLHLWGAAHTPLHTDTLATWAGFELAVSGYSPVLLSNPAANWTISSIGAGAQADHLPVSWTFGGACTVFGYYLTDGTATYSLWAEAFATSFPFGGGGGPFTLELIPWLASYPDVGGIPCTSP